MFRASAKQGDFNAQEALGQLYGGGPHGDRGVPPNDVLAYMLFSLSAAQGNETAKTRKDALEKRLTPEQIKSAQSLSSEWRPGSALPSTTSYEDRAPEVIFGGKDAPAAIYKSSRGWFSRQFKSKGVSRYAVFVATKGEDYHAAGAVISVATFGTEGPQDGYMSDVVGQAGFTQSGSYGEVDKPKDGDAPYDFGQSCGLD